MTKIIKYWNKEDPEAPRTPSYSVYNDSGKYVGAIEKGLDGSWYVYKHIVNRFGIPSVYHRKVPSRKKGLEILGVRKR